MYRLLRGYPWLAQHYAAAIRRAWRFRRLFYAAVDADFCPFCGAGRFVKTGTAGRLTCSECASIALDGRKHDVNKITEKP